MKKRNIAYETYLDKIYGGWLGKSIGGTIGAPFESHKIYGDITADNCWPSVIYPNDDLDIQVVWLEMMEETGPNFTRDDLVKFWQDRCWYNFSEYGYFLYNVQRGIHPPLSGRFNNISFRESMGCPIRAEIWGMVSPGNPDLASRYAKMDGELDHIDNSVWAEQFWAAVISEAFFAYDFEEALDAGRNAIPGDSVIYRISFEVPELWSAYEDLKIVWQELIRRYGHRDATKGEINFAFTLLSLYAGKGIFKDTIAAAINCGWDTDCTAATAGSVLGVLKGAAGLPEGWKIKMGDRLCCDVAVRHKEALIYDFAKDTCKVGLEVMFDFNSQVEIASVPQKIMCQVEERKSTRSALAEISIEASYPNDPVLYGDKVTEVVLEMKNSGSSLKNGSLKINSPNGILVSPTESNLRLIPGNIQKVTLNIYRDSSSKIIWDKNLFEAIWKEENGEKTTYSFGLAGSRQWQVYGPYWDAWDTSKSDICPYRNCERIVNPCLVEGCGRLETHQYVRLDREYLDEKRLIKESLTQERPYLVERGEDYIDNEHLSGFTGEACFYLVREIVSRTPVKCAVNIGATGPFTIWLDGEEVLRNEESSAWGHHDYSLISRFDENPRRIVIKCIRPADHFRFSMWFMMLDIAGDKTRGISYMLDCMGDIAGTYSL